MNRRSKVLTVSTLIGLGVVLVVHGCEHSVEKTIAFPAPIGKVSFRTFSVLEWITTPIQEIHIKLKQRSDLKQLIDLRVFGAFQPEMTDDEVITRFGNANHMRTDGFGGTWASYATPLGYVEIGFDKRTSASEEDEPPVPGRRSLRAYTEKSPSEIFRRPLQEIFREAEKMSLRAETREFDFFDSEGHLIMDTWVKYGRIEHMELFKDVDQ